MVMLRTLALGLLALLAYLALMAGTIWIVIRTAPAFIGWLDASLTPNGTRALPVAVTALLALVAYFVWLGRRDAATRSSTSG